MKASIHWKHAPRGIKILSTVHNIHYTNPGLDISKYKVVRHMAKMNASI